MVRFVGHFAGFRVNASREQVERGQAVYTKPVLTVYDFVVLGISNRFIWKCPTPRLKEHYERHLTLNHLDVGVGSGYFLDHCRFPPGAPRVALLDENPVALEFAARRIAHYRPETWRWNVLEAITLDTPAFDSVAVGYLLHCLPGSMASKSVVFDNLRPLMSPGAVLFGATLLSHGVERSWAARRLMAIYNKKGIFSNDRDDLDGLHRELNRRFDEVKLEVLGCGALFSGRVRR
jgi:hypothetical protein